MEIPHGFVENQFLYRNKLGAVASLSLQEVNDENLTETIERYVANFEKFKSKLDKTLAKIDSSQNKGSFLTGLLNIKSAIDEHEGLGDYQSLLDQIEKYENLLQDYVSKNRQKNTDIKQALLLEMETILSNNDMVEAFELIKDLKARWVKTGSADVVLSTELESKFSEGLNGFFERRKSFLEAQNLLKSARVEDYQAIIDQVQTFIKTKNFTHSVNKVKELQKEWKEKGSVPADDFKRLNDSYWKVCQTYFAELKKFRAVSKKSKSTDEKEILAERQAILGKMNDLVDRRLQDVQKELNQLKGEWKSAGSLPKSKFSAMQDEFMIHQDMVNEQLFVLKMATQKNKGFAQKDDKDKLQLSIQVLKNLLKRDKDELSAFSENLGNMHINKGTFVDMLEAKLKGQEKKVNRKQRLLKMYQEQFSKLKSN